MARILIADDEEGIRDFMGDTLMLSGHQVDLAEDGQQAVRLLSQHRFDLMLCDLKMPKLDGMAVLTQALTLQPGIKLIMISAHGTIDVAVEAMKQGAYDYIQKPVDSPRVLKMLVERALEHQSLERQQQAQRTQQPQRTLSWGAGSMAPVLHQIQRVAPLATTVLLTGESGTGKEVFANVIHTQSQRTNGPFVAINCAAIAPSLLESELFGHEKGAFTGALQQKKGRLEVAHGGTCFLDEVGELPLTMQTKLLRILETRCFERVGGNRTIEVDVRWVAATNRDLKQMIKAGTFREDLYHRLAIFPVHLPPLRQRKEDIWPMAQALLQDIVAQMGQGPRYLAPTCQSVLQDYGWPGNVRELRNVLERVAIMSETAQLTPDDFDLSGRSRPQQSVAPRIGPLKDLERQAIVDTMAATGGNRTQAAKILGIGVRTLYDKIKRYGLDE